MCSSPSLLILASLIAACLSIPFPMDPALNTFVNNVMTMNGGSYSMMMQAMVDNKMLATLSPGGPLTLFLIPNDVYQRVMTSETGKTVQANPDMLKRFLGRHMVMQKLTPSDITNDMSLTTVSGEKIRLNIYDKIMSVNGMMMTLEQSAAPMPAIPNVVMYRLSGVIMPCMGVGIMDVLTAKNSTFSTLIQALQTAGLADQLNQGGPYTLFAPTNDAFKALPDGTMAKLTASPADLKKLLLGHVVSGTYFMPGLMNGELPTLDGGRNKITVSGTTITVDGATIINDMAMMNMFADNGVVLAIDRVLLS